MAIPIPSAPLNSIHGCLQTDTRVRAQHECNEGAHTRSHAQQGDAPSRFVSQLQSEACFSDLDNPSCFSARASATIARRPDLDARSRSPLPSPARRLATAVAAAFVSANAVCSRCVASASATSSAARASALCVTSASSSATRPSSGAMLSAILLAAASCFFSRRSVFDRSASCAAAAALRHVLRRAANE